MIMTESEMDEQIELMQNETHYQYADDEVGGMTNTRAIELLKIERECINRNNQPFGKNCNRECSKCDLVQNTEELLEMYDFVIEQMKEKMND